MIIKRILAAIFFLLSVNIFYSQDSFVITFSTGSGNTETEAINEALRNAIEKTLGSFISAKTELSNDEIVSDRVLNISQGNIQSYEVLSEVVKNDIVTVILRVEITPQEVIELLKGEGFEAEYKGSVFAQNILIEEYYKKQEPLILEDYISTWNGVQFFEYELKDFSEPFKLNQETIEKKIIEVNNRTNIRFPKSYRFQYFENGDLECSKINVMLNSILNLKGEIISGVYYNNINQTCIPKIYSKNWAIRFKVETRYNENFSQFYNGLLNIIKAISITEDTANKLSQNGIEIVKISSNEKNKFIYLRNSSTLDLLIRLSANITKQIYYYNIKANNERDIAFLQELGRNNVLPKGFDINERLYEKSYYDIKWANAVVGTSGLLDLFSMIRYIESYPRRNEGFYQLFSFEDPQNMVLTYYQDTRGNSTLYYKLMRGKYFYREHEVYHVFNNIDEIMNLKTYNVQPLIVENLLD